MDGSKAIRWSCEHYVLFRIALMFMRRIYILLKANDVLLSGCVERSHGCPTKFYGGVVYKFEAFLYYVILYMD
jgi:hypothetical protein